VAAKLALGFTLDELSNDITGGATPASFEPTLDYVVTKFPRFDFEKFPEADAVLTTQMKSVGECMAIGRTIQESLQKAMRGLEIGANGFDSRIDPSADPEQTRRDLINRLRVPKADRLWYLADAFRTGFSLEDIFDICKIDPWFLAEIEDIVKTEGDISGTNPLKIDADLMREWKRKGFSDARLGEIMVMGEDAVRSMRHELGVRPVYKRVDSCAAEFPTPTAYMYSTYEEECESEPTDKKKVVVLGGGPNRIGQGIEFDYCCVHASMALGEDGYETIMVNCTTATPKPCRPITILQTVFISSR